VTDLRPVENLLFLFSFQLFLFFLGFLLLSFDPYLDFDLYLESLDFEFCLCFVGVFHLDLQFLGVDLDLDFDLCFDLDFGFLGFVHGRSPDWSEQKRYYFVSIFYES